MIRFINDANEAELFTLKTVEHLPRLRDEVTYEDYHGIVRAVSHDYSDGENVYVYLQLTTVKQETGGIPK